MTAIFLGPMSSAHPRDIRAGDLLMRRTGDGFFATAVISAQTVNGISYITLVGGMEYAQPNYLPMLIADRTQPTAA